MKLDYNKNALDIFRLIGTIQVFLGHFITQYAFTHGAIVNTVYFVRGVPILFVLCGFLAAKSLENRSTKDWLLGRLVRIVPGVWACVAVNTVIILLVYATKPTLLEGLIYGVTQFFGMNFYTGDWLRGYGSGAPNGVLWTIPVQIQFFLLAPFFHKFLKKHRPLAGGCLVAIFAVVSILVERSAAFLPEILYKLLGVTVLPYLYFLLAGMAGWYYRDKLIPALQKVKWWVLAAYIGWKLMEIFLKFPHYADGVLYNTVTTLLMAAVIFAFGFGCHWRMKQDYTFGFYLYHMVFVNLALYLGFDSTGSLPQIFLTGLVIVVVTLIFSWLSKKFVEEPAVRLLKKRGS